MLSLESEIKKILIQKVNRESPIAPKDSPWARGSVQQGERMMSIVGLIAANYEGDMCEIGCLAGGTTSMLAKIANDFGKRVIAVDPWENGRPDYNPLNYERFLDNTRHWKDIIDVVRLPSEDEEAIKYIKSRKLCFAYVDGDHDNEHCRRDIETVGHATVICIDDLWKDTLLSIFNESPRKKVYNFLAHEGYLI